MADNTALLAVGESPPAVLDVETVDSFERFLELEAEWNSLVGCSGVAHPFVLHQTVRAWWEAFGQDRQMRVLVARQGRQAIAIAPLMLCQERMYGVQVRELGFIYNAQTPRFDFIVAPGHPSAYQALWRRIDELGPSWDVLKFSQVAAGSALLGELERACQTYGWVHGAWPSIESPYLRLPSNWDEYFEKLPRERRANLRRRLKRLEERGPVALEVITGGEQVETALADGFRMEAAAWKGGHGTAIASDPATARFYTRLAERMAAAGYLYLAFLKVGGNRVAFDYCLTFGRNLFTLKPGYEPEYRTFSPGNLLRTLYCQDAIAKGLEEYDFLGGADPWKLEWTAERRSHHWLFAFQKGFRNLLLHYGKFRLLPWLQQNRLYEPFRDKLLAVIRGRPPGKSDPQSQ